MVNSVYTAWQIFQNFANIVFVIMLLIIIFSQVTGIGIDNYGIKKTLPKLIVAIILINLSYIICQLCVDVSNIVGKGLYGLFNGWSDGLGAISQIEYNGQTAEVQSNAGATVLSALLPAMAGAGVILAYGWAIILPLLLGALSAIIAVIFLFLLLSIRKAAVVVLVVISPMAVICYALPNMKKWFDKWKNAFVLMLLLFPICSLLVGGGNFVSKLLLSAGGTSASFFSALSAMLIGLAPIFFIPSLLKSSFAGLGNLGAKISGMGSKLSGKATGAIKGSDAYGRARNRMIAGGENSLRARIATKTGIGRNAISRARAGVIQDKARTARDLSMMGAGYEAARIAEENAVDKKRVEDEEVRINKATNYGAKADDLFSIYDKAVASGDKFTALAVANIAGRRKDTAKAFADHAFGGSVDYSGATGQAMLSSVSKQIAEGGASKNYRAASPLTFEYASRVNDGKAVVTGADGQQSFQGYSDWVNSTTNFDNALNHHVTTADEMVGTQNGSLGFIATRMEQIQQQGGQFTQEEQRVIELAQTVIKNEAQGLYGTTFDTTKKANIQRIANAMQSAPAPTPASNSNLSDGQTVLINRTPGFGEDGGETGE